MVETKKEGVEKSEHAEEKENEGGYSNPTNGTHETKNSEEEKRVAQRANGSGEYYGNEPEE